jgi:FMN phosphatase YigB (HAD superfamily)
MNNKEIKNIILDLNGVLVILDRNIIKNEQKKLNVNFKTIVEHSVWKKMEKGLIKRDKCYSIISKDTGYSIKNIVNLINIARDCLYLNENMIKILKELKTKYNIFIICVSNMSKYDIIYLKNKFNDFFDIFDIIFNSGFIQMNKSENKIYEFIINIYNIESDNTLFIDNDENNIYMAKKHRFKTMHYKYEETDDKNICEYVLFKNEKIIKKGILLSYNYLIKNTNKYGLYTTFYGKGEKLKNKKPCYEIFASAIILSINKQIALHKIGKDILNILYKNLSNDGLSKFIYNNNEYPYDVDTTSIVSYVLYYYGLMDIDKLNKIVDLIFDNINEKGIILTFFDNNKKRLDPTVCVNALYIAYIVNRGEELKIQKNKEFIIDYITNNKGNLYYSSRYLSLYFIVKLHKTFPNCFKNINIKEIIKKEIKQKKYINRPLDLACKIIICNKLGIDNDNDLDNLISLQLDDGSWEYSTIYTTSSEDISIFGDNNIHFVNNFLTTAFAMKAIETSYIRKKCQFLDI